MFKKKLRSGKLRGRKSENTSNSYRKELLRKTKPELIRLCKKNGLPQYGTKTDLINRLIKKQENKNSNTKTSASSSKKRKQKNNDQSITISKVRKSQKTQPGSKGKVIPPAELLVDGYIREQFIEPYNMLYPYDLTKIFCEFLDHIWVCPEKYNHCMKRNGSLICRPPLNTDDNDADDKNKKNVMNSYYASYEPKKKENVDMIIGYSRGFDKGVFEFQLKCINPAMDAIGIMSEIDECGIEQWINAAKGNTYYYVPGSKINNKYGYGSGGGGGIFSGSYTKNSPREQFMDEEGAWKTGDIIKLRVDCDNLTCQFFKNGKQVGKTINIEPNCSYHPVLATSRDGSEYELIMN